MELRYPRIPLTPYSSDPLHCILRGGCACRNCTRGGSRHSAWCVHVAACGSAHWDTRHIGGLSENTLQTINWGWRRCLIKSGRSYRKEEPASPSQT